jgi:hypothetical protein
VIERVTETRDVDGSVIETWPTYATVQASIEPRSGREYLAAQSTQADVTFKCNFLPDDTTQGFATTGILKDYEDGVLRNFELLFPDPGATKASFAAYVANIQPTAPVGSALELNVTLRITGPVTWS